MTLHDPEGRDSPPRLDRVAWITCAAVLGARLWAAEGNLLGNGGFESVQDGFLRGETKEREATE